MERRRVIGAALGLLLLGLALFGYRRLSPAPAEGQPQPVIFSADGSARMSSLLRRFASLLGRGSGRPVTVAEVRRVLSSASDDPLARPFAEQFMKEPVLKKAWEAHHDEDEAQTFIKDVVETPEFAKLLEQHQQNPDFLGLAERTVGTLEGDVAQRSASSDRMMLTSAEPAPPPPAAFIGARTLSQPARSQAFASDLARYKSIFSMMEPEPRKRVLAELERGHSVQEACGRANAAAACNATLKACQADQDCARALGDGGIGGPTKDSKQVVVLKDDRPPADDEAPEGKPAEDKSSQPTRSDSGGGDDDDDPKPATSNPFKGLTGRKGAAKSPTTTKTKSPSPNQGPYCFGKTCFVAGTRVLTPAGEVAIETIRPGDTVLSADLRTGESVAATVLKTFKAEAKGLRRLTFSNGLELRITEEHPVFDPDTGGFRPVRELAIGDHVGRLSRSGGVLGASLPWLGGGSRRPAPVMTFELAVPIAGLLETLTLVAIVELPSDGVGVYNFHVGGHENYFAEGVLVHNKVCAE